MLEQIDYFKINEKSSSVGWGFLCCNRSMCDTYRVTLVKLEKIKIVFVL